MKQELILQKPTPSMEPVYPRVIMGQSIWWGTITHSLSNAISISSVVINILLTHTHTHTHTHHVQVHRINKAAASIAKQAAKDVQEATGN